MAWLFFPISPFCDLFMDVPPSQGANSIWKYLCEFFNAIFQHRIKLQKVGRNFTNFATGIALVFQTISKKLSRSNFFMKFHVRIWTKFGTKRHKFHVKRMSIHLGKKSNSFTHKRAFLSTLTLMNKKFIENLVGRIWGSNLSQNSIHTMMNVW